MLRFERLNEPSWALLFLDPNCERQFGLPAVELCALVGSPYASLMEPEARYQLHDAIQQQLTECPHYLIRYSLHTAAGTLSLLEMGEAYKQHNRHLLRGYLLVVDGLFEGEPLLPALTALENVMLPLELAGRSDASTVAHTWLQRVGLGERLHHYPKHLSGGEQQRVALARAFAPQPSLVLADEPTGNLDAATGAQIIDLMFELNAREGTTLILVTHDAALAARCQRVLQLQAGRLLA